MQQLNLIASSSAAAPRHRHEHHSEHKALCTSGWVDPDPSVGNEGKTHGKALSSQMDTWSLWERNHQPSSLQTQLMSEVKAVSICGCLPAPHGSERV